MNTWFPILVATSCLLASQSTDAAPARFLDVEEVVFDDRFYRFVDSKSQIEVLADGFEWAEGPVWVQSLDAVLFSDVAKDTVYRWDEISGLAVYLQPSGHAPDDLGSAWRGSNGLAVDSDGALILAQQSNRTLARMLANLDDPAPKYEVLAKRYDGKSINSPNDLVVHPSGDIYFTDPPYGLAGFEKSPDIELGFFGVFRLTKAGVVSVVARDLEKPNGIALSSDHSTLYVSNSETDKAQIVAIDLDEQGNPKGSRLFFDGGPLISDGPGSTDGMSMHPDDYLFVSIPNGLGILSPKGELLGKVALGQVTNMTFDSSGTQLFVTTPKRLLRLRINANPLGSHP